MLASIPLVGRLFGAEGEASFATLEDAQHVVERMADDLRKVSEAKAAVEAALDAARAARVEELEADLVALRSQRAVLDETIAAKARALAAARAEQTSQPGSSSATTTTNGPADGGPAETTVVAGARVTAALLRQNDDATTTAIIAALSGDSVFADKSRDATAMLLKRDAEDDEKLAEGVALGVRRGVLAADVQVEPVRAIDVTGRTADEVADLIQAACLAEHGASTHNASDDGSSASEAVPPPISEGRVVVLQGLSGTGKGTTVSKLLARFDAAVSWSNGNVFRSLTLLALEYCANREVPFDETVLAPENVARWIGCLRFDLFPEGYDILIDGEGVRSRVSHIATTTLKEPRIGRAIPTVAAFAQGEVVAFADAALQRMRRDGLTCLVEGRAPTLAYIRTPLRFELKIDDPTLLGARRVAQRVAGLALDHLAKRNPGAADDDSVAVDDALRDAVRAL